MKRNQRNRGDGLRLLRSLRSNSVPLIFFDPQYREILDKMSYGNKTKMIGRLALKQMSSTLIQDFLLEEARVLCPSGHIFWWVDKFMLASGLIPIYTFPTKLETVDLITWQKSRIGMGYRTRRNCEYVVVLQKLPTRAKGVWTDKSIPDVWTHQMEIDEIEKNDTRISWRHPHAKPEGLQRRLIEATTRRGQLVVDPTAGGYSVMRSAMACGRQFLGCDVR